MLVYVPVSLMVGQKLTKVAGVFCVGTVLYVVLLYVCAVVDECKVISGEMMAPPVLRLSAE